jgi:hypothetical protein
MAKDYKYEDSTPVDEPVRRGKIKTQQPGSGIRVRPLSDMERAEEMSKLKEMRAAKFSPEAMEARYDAANPDKYSSVRPTGFSKDLSRLKDMASDRTKDAAVSIAKGTAKSMIPAVGTAMAGGDFSKGARELEMGQRLRDTAKSMQGSADREMTDQIRRESRGVKDDSLRGKFSELTGMKKGGKVSASSRADGCCTKGKTRGKMM